MLTPPLVMAPVTEPPEDRASPSERRREPPGDKAAAGGAGPRGDRPARGISAASPTWLAGQALAYRAKRAGSVCFCPFRFSTAGCWFRFPADAAPTAAALPAPAGLSHEQLWPHGGCLPTVTPAAERGEAEALPGAVLATLGGEGPRAFARFSFLQNSAPSRCQFGISFFNYFQILSLQEK